MVKKSLDFKFFEDANVLVNFDFIDLSSIGCVVKKNSKKFHVLEEAGENPPPDHDIYP